MDETVLGKNIQYMRELHGETLEELGSVLYMAKSTIKDYESGRRNPNQETIKKISQYFGKTVDEMLNAKLYELEKFDSTEIVDIDVLQDVFYQILPLVESKEAYENDSFSKGMVIIKKMLNSFRKGDTVKGLVISEAMECFAEAVEAGVHEAVANMLWCIFFLWSEQYTDLDALKKFQSRVVAKQVDWKEMIYETKRNAKKTEKRKMEFVEDFDCILNELIGELKGMEKWASLGDYYLALRYVLGMVETDFSNEMNQAVGMQMMQSFAHIGNEYALEYLNVDIEKQ